MHKQVVKLLVKNAVGWAQGGVQVHREADKFIVAARRRSFSALPTVNEPHDRQRHNSVWKQNDYTFSGRQLIAGFPDNINTSRPIFFTFRLDSVIIELKGAGTCSRG